VDGEFWAEVDSATVTEHGLYKGVVLSEEELWSARRAGERALAMGRALNLLGYRARSTGEVEQRLRRHGYAEETVEAVISRLKELGYLDGEEYARSAAREKARKYGPRRVYTDLLSGGVEEDTVRRAVEEEFHGRSELEDAFSAAARRYNAGEGSVAQARRVYGFLMRRGYSAEVCAEVARGYRGAPASEAGE
jgi:regulatory protein